jgi:type IX secretion system PorP/SprF family membrane protein
MKKILIILFALLSTSSIFAQELPISENYFVDQYSLSSAYAGNSSNKAIFATYRKDWAGLSEGPRTIRLSYNDGFKNNAGFGGKLIMDKIGIFQSLFAIGSYSYRVKLDEASKLFFGLSAGIHQNSINFSDYYNDPNFTGDPSMMNKDVKSKMKFVSDFSLVYANSRFQAGFLFSNVGISDYKYAEIPVKYSPFMTYQLHANYSLPIQEIWTLTPLVIYRGGKNIGDQLEFAANLMYKNKFWGNVAHRGKSILCIGFGVDISKGIIFNYTYNLSTAVAVNSFQNHELTIGVRLSDLFSKEKSLAAN